LAHAFDSVSHHLQTGSEDLWFAPVIKTTALPFMETQIADAEPVCLRVEPIRIKALQLDLKTAWLKGSSFVADWAGRGSCLWLRVLAFNQEMNELSNLSGPFSDLSFQDLPESLPDELYSRSLVVFLSRIKGAFLACRKDLDRFFDRLWVMSDPAFNKIFSQACREKSDQYRTNMQFHKSRQYATGQEEVPPIIQLSLQFMGFKAMPSSQELRRRYREMARRYHPDVEGGSDEKFQMMLEHYNRLHQNLSV
jgi:hypothetical protein